MHQCRKSFTNNFSNNSSAKILQCYCHGFWSHINLKQCHDYLIQEIGKSISSPKDKLSNIGISSNIQRETDTHCFTLCVQGRCSLIQQKHLGFSYQSPGDGNSLLLATTQLSALITNICLITLQRNNDSTYTLIHTDDNP